MTARDVLTIAAVLWPALRTAAVVVDRGLALLAGPPDLDGRIEAFRSEFERRCPFAGEITRGQALDAIESPGRHSAAVAIDSSVGLLDRADRDRLLAGVELARRAAGCAA